MCIAKHHAPGRNKVQKVIFSFKVKVKVKKKYDVSIFYGSKVTAKVKVDNRLTDRQTNKQIDRQDKNNMPRLFDPGHKIHIIELRSKAS